jgi:hypothetical protein
MLVKLTKGFYAQYFADGIGTACMVCATLKEVQNEQVYQIRSFLLYLTKMLTALPLKTFEFETPAANAMSFL